METNITINAIELASNNILSEGIRLYCTKHKTVIVSAV